MQLSTDSYFIIALLTGLLGLMVAAILIFVNISATLYSGLLAVFLSGLLKSSPEYFQFTLEALGREAGFNSRTAFINAVKKNTGMPPSEFFGRKSECILN